MSEVKSSVLLEVRRTFNAPLADLYRAWTDPAELKQWFAAGPTQTPDLAEVDLQVGGKYRMGMRNADGELHVATDSFREIKPEEKLVYSWSWEASPEEAPETLVTIEFHKVEGGTEVSLRHEQFPDEEARDSHRDGWEGIFDQLGVYFSRS
jgi:uncharacterized protein YndB with AHSA1/START domain